MKSHLALCLASAILIASPTFSVGESPQGPATPKRSTSTLYCALPASPIFEVTVNHTDDVVQFRGGPAFAVSRKIGNDGVINLLGGTSTFDIRINLDDTPLLTFGESGSALQTAICFAQKQ